MSIKKKTLDEYNNLIENDRKYSTLQHLMSSLKNRDFDVNRTNINEISFTFNKELLDVPVTNQFHSGRCWIFAGLNIMRRKMIHKYRLDPNFELSQSYIFMYDKIEKCNMLLETMYIRYKKDKNYNTTLEYRNLLNLLLSDGGTWNMFSAVIVKYGVCPKDSFPDNIHCRNTDKMNAILYKILAKGCFDIFNDKMNISAFKSHKKKVMFECYKILRLFIGKPPEQIEWKNKKYTPTSFYNKTVKPLVNVEEYVSICSIPNYKLNTLMGQKNVFNIHSDDDIECEKKIRNVYLNLDNDTFKKCIMDSISKKSTAVWFACDFEECIFKNSILDKKSCILDEIFDLDLDIPKKDVITSMMTVANHAMVICGYNKESDGTISRWKVENSHGDKNSKYKGYLLMTSNWFDMYANIAAVPINCLPLKLRSEVKTTPKIWLDFWNYLGFVAK